MVTIRKARLSDREGWKRMRKALWPECSENRHDLEIDQILSSNGIVLIAELSSSDLVGFVEISIRSDHVEGATISPIPYLEGWYVNPVYRRQGIGKDLVRSAEGFALQAGFTELASDAEINNYESIEIHKHLGFKEAGRTVHFIKPMIGVNS